MPTPKLLVNTKTPHELPVMGVDIVTEVNKNRKDGANKYLRAVHQLHGYMYYNKVDYDPTSMFELPKTILLLEGRSKINTPIPGLKLGRENQAGESAKDLRFLLQDAIGGSYSKVVRAKAFIPGQDPETCTGTSVIVKMYDLYNPKAIPKYKKEVAVYKHLSSLQGTHIPRLYVSSDHIDGGYCIVVLEDCGKEMNEHPFKDPATKEQAKKVLLEIHQLGGLARNYQAQQHNLRQGKWF
ncbi:hypothetical protein TWF569_008194 [Orbilia oligospora]|nr:hypothetical protein TWF569_008194 [Orbilia oligospora]